MKGFHYVLVGIFLAAASAYGENNSFNILLITSEDNGPELSCYGEPYVKTPHLDRLARTGVRFNRAFVTQPGCSQSRSSILTGLYPHQNGQIGLATWGFRMYQDETPNMVRSLKEVGYRTGIIGKLHINPASAFPFDFKEIPAANFARNKLTGYEKRAGEFIRASEQPFFLMVNYPDAHRPFIPQVDDMPKNPLTGDDVKPLAYLGVDHPELRKQTADYYSCMERLDTLIGKLLDTLKKSGKAENTLVIYLGDHGADLLRGKRTPYEGGLRVPLIVSWPGQAKAGQVRQELVSMVDLFPTTLDISDGQVPNSLPGRSLLPLLKGETPDWREYLFAEWHLHSPLNFYPQRTVRNDRYKLIHNLIPGTENPGYDWTMDAFFPELADSIIEGDDAVSAAYKRMKRPPEFELYDLRRDPYEFNNLSGDKDHRQILEKLKRELTLWQQRTNDPLRHPKLLGKLKAEIEATFANGEPEKRADRTWHYPDYLSTAP